MARGRWSGLMATLAFTSAAMLHVAAAAGGLSIFSMPLPTLYLAVKLTGAAYLIWLGISLFCRKAEEHAPLPEADPKSGRRAFAESVVVEVLNPKTALFFHCVSARSCVDASAALPVWAQFLILGNGRKPGILVSGRPLRRTCKRRRIEIEAFGRAQHLFQTHRRRKPLSDWEPISRFRRVDGPECYALSSTARGACDRRVEPAFRRYRGKPSSRRKARRCSIASPGLVHG